MTKDNITNSIMDTVRFVLERGVKKSDLLSIMTTSMDGFVGSFVSIAIGSGLVGSGIALLFAGLLTISKGPSNT